MIAALAIYHVVLLLGLSTMLTGGLGWLTFAVYTVYMPLGAMLIWRWQGRSVRASGFDTYPGVGRHVAGGLLAAALIPCAILGVMVLVDWAQIDTVRFNVASLARAIILPQIFVAAFEELAFRGVTQPLLSARWGPARGLWITALLFGIFHLPNALHSDVPPALLPLTLGTLTLMGIVFGLAYQRTGQHLALPVALHFAWNVASFGAGYVADITFSGPPGITGTTAWFPESGLLGTAGLVLLGIIVTAMRTSPAQRTRTGT